MGKILIGADLVPTKSNYELFKKKDTEMLFGDKLLDVIMSADYRIFNLETPLCDRETPIDKSGPTLITPTSVSGCFVNIQVNLFSLANNHILDQGQEGIKSTRETLESLNIPYVGIGDNLNNAGEPFIFEIDGIKYGVYSCAEHEFSIATETTAGANPYDPLVSFDHVRSLHEKCDYVIVLFHGGKEHFRYPSPNIQRLCRKFVDSGANLVVCQHSHCVGCEERYNKGTIVYGQGNFIFDDSENDYWQTGLLVEIEDNFDIKYYPLRKHKNIVRLADEQDAEQILQGFNKRSQEILGSDFVSDNFSRLSQEYKKIYLLSLTGVDTQKFYFRVLNKITGHKYEEYLINKCYQKNKRLRARNYINCETHREMLLELLK